MRLIATAACAALVCHAAQAQEPQDKALTLGGALDYSSGDYGTGTETRITSVAATARYDTGPWAFKAYVPWIKVTGNQSVIPGLGRVRGGSAERTSESGLGDIVLGATYAALYDKPGGFGLDFTTKVKLPTADEKKGLGTGETDFIFLADLYKTFDRVTGFGGVGYHVLGDPPGVDLDNVWSANVGASYKLDERDSVGVSLYGRERVAPGADRQRELMGFLVHKFDQFWKMQLYALIGLADGSPDYGFGLSVARPF